MPPLRGPITAGRRLQVSERAPRGGFRSSGCPGWPESLRAPCRPWHCRRRLRCGEGVGLAPAGVGLCDAVNLSECGDHILVLAGLDGDEHVGGDHRSTSSSRPRSSLPSRGSSAFRARLGGEHSLASAPLHGNRDIAGLPPGAVQPKRAQQAVSLPPPDLVGTVAPGRGLGGQVTRGRRLGGQVVGNQGECISFVQHAT
jgi:hypothetical protein